MKKLLLATILLITITISIAAALNVPSRPEDRVTDYTSRLDRQQTTAIESLIARYEKDTTNQIAVAIFESLKGENLEDFSIRLAEQWKIGQKEKDNGVILLIFLNDRKLRIEVGYGLEGSLTDAMSNTIINSVIVPYFKKGQYEKGILVGVASIMKVISPEYDIANAAQPQQAYNQYAGTSQQVDAAPLARLIILVVLILLFIDSVRYMMYKSRNGHYRYSSMEWWTSFAITMILLKIIMMIALSSGRHRGYGSGSGGFSSGGFSGGGGSFGGGGSSGGW